jgi:Toprim domain
MSKGRPGFINNKILFQISQNADWKKVFLALGLERDPKKSKDHDWWCRSPLSDEQTASFHLNSKGWYCHSTRQGGGVVQLVQAVMKLRGQPITCYEAGQWLLDKGCSDFNESSPTPTTQIREAKENSPSSEKKKNSSVLSLLPYLRKEHPEFDRRGISKATLDYLGAGYLPFGKGAMDKRLVFQIRGVERDANGNLKPVILSHIGRATTQEQIDKNGKYWMYSGFNKSLEIYNLDKVLLDEKARLQAKESQHVLILEGCFDVAKLIESNIYNVVASFGACLYESQLPRLKFLAGELGIKKFTVWYDRDKAGIEGQKAALELLQASGFEGKGFDWSVRFDSIITQKDPITLIPSVKDACDFTKEQLQSIYSQVLKSK